MKLRGSIRPRLRRSLNILVKHKIIHGTWFLQTATNEPSSLWLWHGSGAVETPLFARAVRRLPHGQSSQFSPLTEGHQMSMATRGYSEVCIPLLVFARHDQPPCSCHSSVIPSTL